MKTSDSIANSGITTASMHASPPIVSAFQGSVGTPHTSTSVVAPSSRVRRLNQLAQRRPGQLHQQRADTLSGPSIANRLMGCRHRCAPMPKPRKQAIRTKFLKYAKIVISDEIQRIISSSRNSPATLMVRSCHQEPVRASGGQFERGEPPRPRLVARGTVDLEQCEAREQTRPNDDKKRENHD